MVTCYLCFSPPQVGVRSIRDACLLPLCPFARRGRSTQNKRKESARSSSRDRKEASLIRPSSRSRGHEKEGLLNMSECRGCSAHARTNRSNESCPVCSSSGYPADYSGTNSDNGKTSSRSAGHRTTSSCSIRSSNNCSRHCSRSSCRSPNSGSNQTTHNNSSSCSHTSSSRGARERSAACYSSLCSTKAQSSNSFKRASVYNVTGFHSSCRSTFLGNINKRSRACLIGEHGTEFLSTRSSSRGCSKTPPTGSARSRTSSKNRRNGSRSVSPNTTSCSKDLLCTGKSHSIHSSRSTTAWLVVNSGSFSSSTISTISSSTSSSSSTAVCGPSSDGGLYSAQGSNRDPGSICSCKTSHKASKISAVPVRRSSRVSRSTCSRRRASVTRNESSGCGTPRRVISPPEQYDQQVCVWGWQGVHQQQLPQLLCNGSKSSAASARGGSAGSEKEGSGREHSSWASSADSSEEGRAPLSSNSSRDSSSSSIECASFWSIRCHANGSGSVATAAECSCSGCVSSLSRRSHNSSTYKSSCSPLSNNETKRTSQEIGTRSTHQSLSSKSTSGNDCAIHDSCSSLHSRINSFNDNRNSSSCVSGYCSLPSDSYGTFHNTVMNSVSRPNHTKGYCASATSDSCMRSSRNSCRSDNRRHCSFDTQTDSMLQIYSRERRTPPERCRSSIAAIFHRRGGHDPSRCTCCSDSTPTWNSSNDLNWIHRSRSIDIGASCISNRGFSGSNSKRRRCTGRACFGSNWGNRSDRVVDGSSRCECRRSSSGSWLTTSGSNHLEHNIEKWSSSWWQRESHCDDTSSSPSGHLTSGCGGFTNSVTPAGSDTSRAERILSGVRDCRSNKGTWNVRGGCCRPVNATNSSNSSVAQRNAINTSPRSKRDNSSSNSTGRGGTSSSSPDCLRSSCTDPWSRPTGRSSSSVVSGGFASNSFRPRRNGSSSSTGASISSTSDCDSSNDSISERSSTRTARSTATASSRTRCDSGIPPTQSGSTFVNMRSNSNPRSRRGTSEGRSGNESRRSRVRGGSSYSSSSSGNFSRRSDICSSRSKTCSNSSSTCSEDRTTHINRSVSHCCSSSSSCRRQPEIAEIGSRNACEGREGTRWDFTCWCKRGKSSRCSGSCHDTGHGSGSNSNKRSTITYNSTSRADSSSKHASSRRQPSTKGSFEGRGGSKQSADNRNGLSEDLSRNVSTACLYNTHRGCSLIKNATAYTQPPAKHRFGPLSTFFDSSLQQPLAHARACFLSAVLLFFLFAVHSCASKIYLPVATAAAAASLEKHVFFFVRAATSTASTNQPLDRKPPYSAAGDSAGSGTGRAPALATSAAAYLAISLPASPAASPAASSISRVSHTSSTSLLSASSTTLAVASPCSAATAAPTGPAISAAARPAAAAPSSPLLAAASSPAGVDISAVDHSPNAAAPAATASAASSRGAKMESIVANIALDWLPPSLFAFRSSFLPSFPSPYSYLCSFRRSAPATSTPSVATASSAAAGSFPLASSSALAPSFAVARHSAASACLEAAGPFPFSDTLRASAEDRPARAAVGSSALLPGSSAASAASLTPAASSPCSGLPCGPPSPSLAARSPFVAGRALSPAAACPAGADRVAAAPGAATVALRPASELPPGAATPSFAALTGSAAAPSAGSSAARGEPAEDSFSQRRRQLLGRDSLKESHIKIVSGLAGTRLESFAIGTHFYWQYGIIPPRTWPPLVDMRFYPTISMYDDAVEIPISQAAMQPVEPPDLRQLPQQQQVAGRHRLTQRSPSLEPMPWMLDPLSLVEAALPFTRIERHQQVERAFEAVAMAALDNITTRLQHLLEALKVEKTPPSAPQGFTAEAMLEKAKQVQSEQQQQQPQRQHPQQQRPQQQHEEHQAWLQNSQRGHQQKQQPETGLHGKRRYTGKGTMGGGQALHRLLEQQQQQEHRIPRLDEDQKGNLLQQQQQEGTTVDGDASSVDPSSAAFPTFDAAAASPSFADAGVSESPDYSAAAVGRAKSADVIAGTSAADESAAAGGHAEIVDSAAGAGALLIRTELIVKAVHETQRAFRLKQNDLLEHLADFLATTSFEFPLETNAAFRYWLQQANSGRTGLGEPKEYYNGRMEETRWRLANKILKLTKLTTAAVVDPNIVDCEHMTIVKHVAAENLQALELTPEYKEKFCSYNLTAWLVYAVHKGLSVVTELAKTRGSVETQKLAAPLLTAAADLLTHRDLKLLPRVR